MKAIIVLAVMLLTACGGSNTRYVEYDDDDYDSYKRKKQYVQKCSYYRDSKGKSTRKCKWVYK